MIEQSRKNTTLRRAARRSVVLLTAGAVAACSRGERSATTERPPVAGHITSVPDTDVAARGAALPHGYLARFDGPDAKPTDISYGEREPGRWEVTTGPAHILYSPSDTARGRYIANATFEQVQAPAHPEAFGVFIGGASLDDPSKQKYTYFLVRGDGTYAVKARHGNDARTITDFTASPAVPKQDANGKALYGIRVESDGRSAKISVNGNPVTTLTPKDGPLTGVIGVRVNHNLHLIVTPVSITR